MKNTAEALPAFVEGIISQQTKPVGEKLRFMWENKPWVMLVESLRHKKVIRYWDKHNKENHAPKTDSVEVKVNWELIEVLLFDENFIKVQQSFLVNFDYVLRPKMVDRDLKLRMKDETLIPVSRDEAKEIKEMCKKRKKNNPK